MTGWLRRTRVRLALAYSGIFGIVAGVAAVALWLAVARLAYATIDTNLAREAGAIQTALSLGSSFPDSVGLSQPERRSATGPGIAAYLFDTSGQIVESSRPGPSEQTLVDIARQAAVANSTLLVTERASSGNSRARAGVIKLKGGETRVLVVTQSQAEADLVVGTAATVLVLGVAVLMIASSVLGYGLAGTALRPVREIVAAARAVNEQDLRRRISLNLPADELGELADTFNGMLDRVEAAFESLRRFTADAAHELRAPLTLIRTEAEVTLSRPRSAAEYQASLGTVLAEAQRLGRMADQLLTLSRVEAGAVVPRLETVDLAVLLDETVRIWKPLASDRSLRLSREGSEVAAVRADRDLLRRLFDNLIDNALRHAPAGSEVAISTRPADGGWEAVVADQGPGVPDAARAAIFERFSRADQSRGRDTGGAGLGLALCAAIAHLHDGTVRLDVGSGPGARFIVYLPGDQREPTTAAHHAT